MSDSTQAAGGPVRDWQSPGIVERARLMAGPLMQGLHDGGSRWRHTQAVAARAAQVVPTFDTTQGDCLQAAAWLHDIGYAPSLARHRFHPIDGADYALDHLTGATVAGLIAHHSGARFVAAARGLSRLMQPFAREDYWSGPVADALTWADQTTGPDGHTVTVQERLRDVLARHGPDSPNARCHTMRAPALIAAVRATEARLDRYRGTR